MGRKPDGDTPRRQTITWRMTRDDADELKATSKHAGFKSVSAYVRHLIHRDTDRRNLR